MNFTRNHYSMHNHYFMHNKLRYLKSLPSINTYSGYSRIHHNRQDYLGVRFEYSNASNTIQEAQEWKGIQADIERRRGRLSSVSDRFSSRAISSPYEVEHVDLEEVTRGLVGYGSWSPELLFGTTSHVLSGPQELSLFSRLLGEELGMSAQTERRSMFDSPVGRRGEALHEEAERYRRASNVKKFLETPVGKALSGAGWGDIRSPDAAAENLRPSASFREYQARRREGARTSYLRRS